MTITVRPAGVNDLEPIAALMVRDAERRARQFPLLWQVASDATDRVIASIRAALENANPPFRQQWLVADDGGSLAGVAHSILLPVPPIYAGEFGPPGLIMEGSCVAQSAPPGSAETLLAAAERDLSAAGARIVLASSAGDGSWREVLAGASYAPLTLYLSGPAQIGEDAEDAVRKAVETDLPEIVLVSAENRRVLFALDSFWQPHPQADKRFGAWMKRSLTLSDRDMLVAEGARRLAGYAVAQPATALHFPAAHDVAGVGFIDDFFHDDFADPGGLSAGGSGATGLLRAAEARLAARGNRAALVVCPAAWRSKIELLEGMGYRSALTWHIRRG